MEVITSNKKLDKIINDDNKLIKTIGLDLARKVRLRCDQMEASDNFKAYLDNRIGDPHPLVGNLDNLFGIKLDESYRLIVKPLSVKLDDESLRNCKEVDLKGVANYHGDKWNWLIP